MQMACADNFQLAQDPATVCEVACNPMYVSKFLYAVHLELLYQGLMDQMPMSVTGCKYAFFWFLPECQGLKEQLVIMEQNQICVLSIHIHAAMLLDRLGVPLTAANNAPGVNVVTTWACKSKLLRACLSLFNEKASFNKLAILPSHWLYEAAFS